MTNKKAPAGMVAQASPARNSNPPLDRRATDISALLAGLILSLMGSPAMAGEMWQEYDKLIDKTRSIATLGPSLMGDQVDLYTGTLSFKHVDVEVPGNDSLPVGITRRYQVITLSGFPFPSGPVGYDGLFGDWTMDIPNISGTFSSTTGWAVGSAATTARCTTQQPPRGINNSYTTFEASDFWNGYQVSLGDRSGGGEVLVAHPGTLRPSQGGPYNWITGDWTYLSCLASTPQAEGEGFQATAADGTKYWFNHMATTLESRIRKKRERVNGSPYTPSGFDEVQRVRKTLYATRVEDRFGNSVTYSYSNTASQPVRLTSILSSDGRSISFTYEAGGRVATAASAGRTWTYTYTGNHLTDVLLPDNQTRWTIALGSLSGLMAYQNTAPGESGRSCTDPGEVIEETRTGSITHPAGTVGQFTIKPTRFSRSNVLLMCRGITQANPNDGTDPNNEADDYAFYPVRWDSFALQQKRLTVPDVGVSEWNYSYFSVPSWFTTGGGSEGMPVCLYGDCISPSCVSANCAGLGTASTVTVVGPDSFKRYRFGTSYRYDEGKLLREETGSDESSIKRVDDYSYSLVAAGQNYPASIGQTFHARVDSSFSTGYLRPEVARVITQDGRRFAKQVAQCDGKFCLDSFARPTKIIRMSSTP